MLMREEELRDDTTLEQLPETEQPSQPVAPAPPISSRFLLVNVAARRAKQLHKGAFPRLSDDELATTVARFENFGFRVALHPQNFLRAHQFAGGTA